MGEMIVVTDETEQVVVEGARPEQIGPTLQAASGEVKPLRSLTRLLIGGALEGWDELLERVKSWEANVSQQQEPVSPISGTKTSPSVAIRYSAIGLAFIIQDRWLRRSQAALNIAGRTTESVLTPVTRRLDNNRRLRPARRRFNQLVERGEAVASQWVDRGRLEEAHSRKLVRHAVQVEFNSSMDQLGQAPALQNLVRKQSAGLTQDVVDEVRSRTVSADILTENLARSILRRTPRRNLPPPVRLSSEEESN
jgi:hypothetical protein